ncbi:uncharacterized protein MAM_02464 [Metarhizium album ARSEF 1941]|uniref:MOZ protein represents a chromatin-associated acetyltransferase n=1 Tax=Metarhizium album (strain ARSEF 1941) TaxID=1081103 RepID=A0A0B2WU65_METAS|nr:uncharacterized protein MAM_02464 [Metarhizium album ARSEF 1941]KHN99611.1 hypothetical protein MAM_02464 [Metarhizium album ARSEF 1941]
MAPGRLSFLPPYLLRVARTTVVPTTVTARRVATTRCKSLFAPRHGKAVEPTWNNAQEAQLSQPAESKKDGHEVAAQGGADATTPTDAKQPRVAAEKTEKPEPEKLPRVQAATPSTSPADSPLSKSEDSDATPTVANSSNKTEEPGQTPSSVDSPASPSLEAVLHMPSPGQAEHPHMAPPPYVHHFDSYSLVKQLEEGGYSREQAVTSMKAIRKILAQNLDVAQKRLVSKSDVENETYLFQAACSELSTEIKNNRRLQEEEMRQKRTHLQHEVDILTQSLNQELLTLNDAVRGLFNDRTMAVREEQKSVESAIQKINYKMSILLSSDSKSEIEGVRWVLIRRSVVGLVFLAILTLGMIRYTTYLAQQKKKEAERRKRERERLKRDGGRNDHTTAADAAVILSAN